MPADRDRHRAVRASRAPAPRGRATAGGGRPIAVLVVSFCVLCSPFAGSALAGDQVAMLSPEPETIEAEPGETFTVDVLMRSQGGHGGEGVVAVSLATQYHPDYLEVTAIERGPWLEGGEETEIRTESALAHEEGTAVLDQRRDPAAGGATGTGVIATLTVAVAADAPPSEATLSVAETAVSLENGWPMATYAQDVTISIDGGGDRHDPYDHPDPASLDASADDSADDASTDRSGSDESSGHADSDGLVDDSSDAVSGFSAALAVLAVLAALAALARDRRE